MIVDEEVYLEHYGVKGMKWGVRKDKLVSGVRQRRENKRAKLAAMTPAQRRKHEAKKARRIRNAAFLGIGAVYLSSISGGHARSTPIRYVTEEAEEIEETTHKISQNARDILRAQERQRNGAFQLKKILKDIGADVVD